MTKIPVSSHKRAKGVSSSRQKTKDKIDKAVEKIMRGRGEFRHKFRGPLPRFEL